MKRNKFRSWLIKLMKSKKLSNLMFRLSTTGSKNLKKTTVTLMMSETACSHKEDLLSSLILVMKTYFKILRLLKMR